MRYITLTNSSKKVAVDDRDFEVVSQYTWRLKNGYAASGSKPLYMHRLIMRTPEEMETDHADMNRLNNCRSNLRIVSRVQNIMNRGAQSNNKSGAKGVIWGKTNKKWKAQIGCMGRKIFIGYFDTVEDASDAYMQAALKYHGNFARRY